MSTNNLAIQSSTQLPKTTQSTCYVDITVCSFAVISYLE